MPAHRKVPIQSMTGYGESSYESAEVYVYASLKSVNSKYLDVDSNLPRAFAKEEMTWRKLLSEHLQRGKVFLTLVCQMRNLRPADVLHEATMVAYGDFLKKICGSLDITPSILPAALRLPGVVRSEGSYNVPQAIRKIVTKTVMDAMRYCVQSREAEGEVLTKQLVIYLASLRKSFVELDSHIAAQKGVLRKRLETRLSSQTLTPQEWDQELTASLNKASVEEEKVRFQSHLDFFAKTLNQGGPVGKKLGFIIQELGRELNTIGAKAQYGPLQHLVIDMKECVEQMREQMANLV